MQNDRETARMLVTQEHCATLEDWEREGLIEAIAATIAAEREACAQVLLAYAQEIERDPEAIRAVPTAAGYGHFAANILVRGVWKIRDRSLGSARGDKQFNRVKALLIQMRKYIMRHGLLIGECVAWNELKQLFDVGQRHEVDDAWLKEYEARPLLPDPDGA